MSAGLTLQLNGQRRNFAELQPGVALVEVVAALGLKADRIAVELNGEIAPRTGWPEATVKDGDRLEVVHFVGGGSECMIDLLDCVQEEQRQRRSRGGR